MEIKPEDSAKGGTKTVLLAEDDESLRTLAQKILQGPGYKVLVVADGREALRVFVENTSGIDLVLLDMIMPKPSGRAVSGEHRKEHPQLPGLFASGYIADTLHSHMRLEEETTFI